MEAGDCNLRLFFICDSMEEKQKTRGFRKESVGFFDDAVTVPDNCTVYPRL